MTGKSFWVVFLFFLMAPGMMAQDVIRLGITKTDVSQFALKTSLWESLLMVDLTQPNALTTISDKLVSAYTNDPGFKVVDYRSYDLVADERERQKGEEFIDGYIVAQGKSEGVNFILSPIFVASDNEITVRVINVIDGTMVCSAATPIIKGKTGVEYTRYYSALLIQQLNSRCFNVQYPVVRMLKEKPGDAKDILVAFGHAHQAKEKQMLGLFINQVEIVNGAEVERQLQIGEGMIEVVEDDNFSIVNVKKGGDKIYQALTDGASVFVRVSKIEK
ncbi:MAG TPA: hypothetical protein VLA46_07310 [Saprospiraceae bacterium]|nr:hypothetical protein [Saprospiraceae bacterium]